MKTEIQITWSIEDIFSLDESLTVEQACKVLEFADREHDANIWINWDFLEYCIKEIKQNDED